MVSGIGHQIQRRLVVDRRTMIAFCVAIVVVVVVEMDGRWDHFWRATAAGGRRVKGASRGRLWKMGTTAGTNGRGWHLWGATWPLSLPC